MRRFWEAVTVERGDDGLVILLDGKPMRIPGGTPLMLTGEPLARAIAAEWQAAGGEKGGEMSMEDVPLTRLAGTAQDRIAPNPLPVAAGLAEYAESDLLCYRAEHPDALVVRQAHEWQPWLDWARRTHGVRLVVTAGITHQPQDPAALERVRQLYAAMPAPVLAALSIAVPAMGSAVLGLALAEGAIGAEEAYRVSNLDELFQREQWGEDAEATRRLHQVQADILLAERFLHLNRASHVEGRAA